MPYFTTRSRADDTVVVGRIHIGAVLHQGRQDGSAHIEWVEPCHSQRGFAGLVLSVHVGAGVDQRLDGVRRILLSVELDIHHPDQRCPPVPVHNLRIGTVRKQ